MLGLKFISDRCRAATKASPPRMIKLSSQYYRINHGNEPLFPGPATIRTSFFLLLSSTGNSFAIAWAQDNPASSISWSTENLYSLNNSKSMFVASSWFKYFIPDILEMLLVNAMLSDFTKLLSNLRNIQKLRSLRVGENVNKPQLTQNNSRFAI